jgi:ATP-dependent Clp protease ATP-binding subunit ClpA
MSAGRLTDATGATVGFRQAAVILTSNIGDGRALDLMGSDRSVLDERQYEESVLEQVNSSFAPEFLGCLYAVVVIKHLALEDSEEIVRIKIRELAARVEGVQLLGSTILPPLSSFRWVTRFLAR